MLLFNITNQQYEKTHKTCLIHASQSFFISVNYFIVIYEFLFSTYLSALVVFDEQQHPMYQEFFHFGCIHIAMDSLERHMLEHLDMR